MTGKMNEMMDLTIFTPTYNRVTELRGLFESIQNSIEYLGDGYSIERLIVDDGSIVDVLSVVEDFHDVNGLYINFFKKENGGKHTAFNYAIDHAQGRMFVCIDDDDRLTAEALKDIFEIERTIKPLKEKMSLGAFVGRVVDEHGEKLGIDLKRIPLISDTIEIRDKYHFWGEPEVYFTDILRKYRFDVFEGEKFLTEAYLFDVMSKHHKFYYTDYPLMVKKYLPGGLTDNQTLIRIKSPRGTEQYYYQRWGLCTGVWNRLKAAINCKRFAWWIKQGRRRRKMGIYGSIAFPVSLLMYIKDKRYAK